MQQTEGMHSLVVWMARAFRRMHRRAALLSLRHAPLLEELVADLAAGLRLLGALHRDAHDVCARVRAPLHLRAEWPDKSG